MVDISVVGCVATHGDVEYKFSCNKEALAFKECCEKGGSPEFCAAKFHGTRKPINEEVPPDEDSNILSSSPGI